MNKHFFLLLAIPFGILANHQDENNALRGGSHRDLFPHGRPGASKDSDEDSKKTTDRDCSTVVYLDINLDEQGFGPHPADVFGNLGADLTVDLYTPCSGAKSGRRNSRGGSHRDLVPHAFRGRRSDSSDSKDDSKRTNVIVIGAGAPTGKSDYSNVAQLLAKAGYLTVVAEKPVELLQISAVIPTDILRIIEYLQSGASPVGDIDINAVIPGGHGFFGAMAVLFLTGQCPEIFCSDGPPPTGPPTGQPLPPVDISSEIPWPLIKAAFGYGGTVFQVVPNPAGGPPLHIHNPTLTNNGVPLLMMFGTGEENLCCTDRADISYAQMVPEKALVVLDDLDHDSIANQAVSSENSIPSTRDPREQNEIVVDTLVEFLDFVLAAEDDSQDQGFCERLDKVPVTECLYEGM